MSTPKTEAPAPAAPEHRLEAIRIPYETGAAIVDKDTVEKGIRLAMKHAEALAEKQGGTAEYMGLDFSNPKGFNVVVRFGYSWKP